MAVVQSQSILFELLRSFTTLARTLNLSHAVRELNSTRQTVRRHIALLEQMRGAELFALKDRHYELTEAGQHALPEAEELLARGMAWAGGHSKHVRGLLHVDFSDGALNEYHLQQHPLSQVWRQGSPLMRMALQCWAAAGADIASEAFEPLRPYMLVYRPMGPSWLCCEIGEKSAFATWFGWAKARSSIGAVLDNLPGGNPMAVLMNEPFSDVASTHGARLDHVHTRLPHDDHDAPLPVSYQRLLMGCTFPDGTFAMAAVIERTHDISILGLSDDKIRAMPEEFVMNMGAEADRLRFFVA